MGQSNKGYEGIETYIYENGNLVTYRNIGTNKMGIYCDYSIGQFANGTFELIEDNNIDTIETLWGNCVGDSKQCRDDFMLKNRAKINELVQGLKQLNKEVQELKEK